MYKTGCNISKVSPVVSYLLSVCVQYESANTLTLILQCSVCAYMGIVQLSSTSIKKPHTHTHIVQNPGRL